MHYQRACGQKGSGSVHLAALEAGMNPISFEKEPVYYNKAKLRLTHEND